MSEPLREWIAALPSDAIAQVVNAHRDAWEAVTSDGKAPNAMRQYEAAARAFRDALLSLVGVAGGGAPSGPQRTDDIGCVFCGQRVDVICMGDGEHRVASRSTGSEERPA